MRIGSLFSGYGGADLAVQSVWPDAHPAWFVEFDKHPSTVLATHWPDVPNYGDVTAVDWAAVEPVDILTGGYPCQPFSHAGQRRGTDDERHLFPYVATAIGVLRPRVVCLENVYGHLTLGGPEVIGTLTGLGYSVRWGVVRASDAGAPHRRARVFIVATADTDCPAGAEPDFGQEQPGQSASHGDDVERSRFRRDAPPDTDGERIDWGGRAGQGRGAESTDSGLTPSDTRSERHGPDPRPVGRVDREDEDPARKWERAREVTGHRSATAPAHADESGPQGRGVGGSERSSERPTRTHSVGFGPYEQAVQRWESILGRPAPQPTVPTGRNGGHRLNPRLEEWMMGLPEGWVTDTGIPHNAQLKALGNGIVPAQMALAVRLLLDDEAVAA